MILTTQLSKKFCSQFLKKIHIKIEPNTYLEPKPESLTENWHWFFFIPF